MPRSSSAADRRTAAARVTAPVSVPVAAAAAEAGVPSAAPAAPSAPRPQGCSHFKLRQLLRRVSQHYDRELAKSGLKSTQYSLLSHVLKLGPLRPGDLAAAMTMDASTLTRNLKPLLAAGYVEQTRGGADGRSRVVAITPAGRAKRAEAQRHWRAAQDALNRRLGPERVVALHALLDGALERLTAEMH